MPKFRIHLSKYYTSLPIEADDIEAAVKLAMIEAEIEPTDWEYENDFDIVEEEAKP